MSTQPFRLSRLWRLPLILLSVVAALMLSGLLLADRLTPRVQGVPSSTLPLQEAQTRIDRQMAAPLAANPGKTGVLYLSDGLEAFAARSVITRHAGRSLDLQYYIWHDDMTGHLLAREVHEAAQRGVRVRLLLDDLNAEGLDASLLALDAHPNIELRVYNPFRNRSGMLRLLEMVQRAFSVNYRMHNKAWIADGRIAIVGGRNIGGEYFDARPDVNFRDLDLLLAGPEVEQASKVFDAFWNSSAAIPISGLSQPNQAQLDRLLARSAQDTTREAAQPYLQRIEARLQRAYGSSEAPLYWTEQVRIHSDPPLKHRDGEQDDWLVTVLAENIGSARDKALLISPYFVPGQAGTEELAALSARGVQVGILTNSLAANDVAAVHGGYMHYRVPLLQAGVQLHEMKPFGTAGGSGLFGSSGASLHTKAFVIDDRRGFVGSFNLDPRSAYLNTEMGVLFDDPVLAARLREEYLRLAAPDLSYWVYLDSSAGLRWLDWAQQPPTALDNEPETSWWQRATARAISWLPIESQL